MSHTAFYSLLLGGVLAVGPSASAQDIETQTTTTTTTTTTDMEIDQGPRVLLFAQGGGWNDLRNLDSGGVADFDTGYNFGGGLGVQLNDWAALRAIYNFARSEGEAGALAPISGVHFNRHYYGADLQVRAPMDSGFSPYLFVGGGAVTIDPSADVLFSPTGAQLASDSFTKPAGRFGVGFEYQIPDSGFGLFAQAAGWVYEWDRFGFDRTQVDTTWGGGISYRFGGY